MCVFVCDVSKCVVVCALCVCVFVCTYIYMCTYVCVYKHTHTHTHIQFMQFVSTFSHLCIAHLTFSVICGFSVFQYLALLNWNMLNWAFT